MKRFAVLALLAALQLIRIERAAAEPADTSHPEVLRGVRHGDLRPDVSVDLDVTTSNGPPPTAGATQRKEYREDAWPRYIIEPPDILSIEGVKLVPKPPYRIETFDVILVRVRGALPDQPIDDAYTIDADGTINLGPTYGRVKIAGLTVDDAQDRVRAELARNLSEVEVSVSLQQAAGFQEISGQHLVAMDGRVNLGIYGSVFVAGMTIDEARAAVEKHLGATLDQPQVAVDVLAYNSKVYYVIIKGAALGDDVVRAPITGNETVLDAIANLGGTGAGPAAKVWLARPAANGIGAEQILPVAWNDIAEGKPTTTNYQLMPGDRLFIQPPQTQRSEQPSNDAAISSYPAPPAVVPSNYEATAEPEADDAVLVEPSPAPASEPVKAFYNLVIQHQRGDVEVTMPLVGDASLLDAVDYVRRTAQDEPTDAYIVLSVQDAADGVRRVQLDTISVRRLDESAARYKILPGDHVTVNVPNYNPAPAPRATATPQQIKFKLAVIEDNSGELANFIRPDQRCAVGETATLEPALRVLEKHQLTKTLHRPNCITNVDEPSEFMIGENVPKLRGTTLEYAFSGTKINVVGHRAKKAVEGGTLDVDLGANIAYRGEDHDVEAGFTIAPGQSAITRLHAPNGKLSPLYVVITPTWIE